MFLSELCVLGGENLLGLLLHDKIDGAENRRFLPLFLDGCHTERMMLATIQNLPDKLYLAQTEEIS